MTNVPPGAVEVVRLQLDDICTDRRFQMRHKLDPGTIHRYRQLYAAEAESGVKVLPPIKVVRIGEALQVTDGFHRVTALRQLKVTEVDAIVLNISEEEAKWEAAKANLEHGLPLKSSELRNVFRVFVKAGHHKKGKCGMKSYRAIAADLGGYKPHNTIMRWMRADFPSIAAQIAGEPLQGRRDGVVKLKTDGSFFETTLEHLRAAVAASRGVTDQAQRNRLRDAAFGLADAIKRNKPVGTEWGGDL
jgi:hypothetical protein